MPTHIYHGVEVDCVLVAFWSSSGLPVDGGEEERRETEDLFFSSLVAFRTSGLV